MLICSLYEDIEGPRKGSFSFGPDTAPLPVVQKASSQNKDRGKRMNRTLHGVMKESMDILYDFV